MSYGLGDVMSLLLLKRPRYEVINEVLRCLRPVSGDHVARPVDQGELQVAALVPVTSELTVHYPRYVGARSGEGLHHFPRETEPDDDVHVPGVEQDWVLSEERSQELHPGIHEVWDQSIVDR